MDQRGAADRFFLIRLGRISWIESGMENQVKHGASVFHLIFFGSVRPRVSYSGRGKGRSGTVHCLGAFVSGQVKARLLATSCSSCPRALPRP
jgi:hypothetical protein